MYRMYDSIGNHHIESVLQLQTGVLQQSTRIISPKDNGCSQLSEEVCCVWTFYYTADVLRVCSLLEVICLKINNDTFRMLQNGDLNKIFFVDWIIIGANARIPF